VIFGWILHIHVRWRSGFFLAPLDAILPWARGLSSCTTPVYRKYPPVRCASAGAERPVGLLRADPAYVVTPQAKNKTNNGFFVGFCFCRFFVSYRFLVRAFRHGLSIWIFL
jgi:hypothetical protein